MLDTSSEIQEGIAAGSAVRGAGRGVPAPLSWSAAQERPPFSALPDGWSVIGRCRFGTGGPGPQATGCYALAHPKVGVALIDIVPNATPNAEARLRRALTAVEFWPDFPGALPVVHNRLDAAALRSLPWVLERWFEALPALTVPGGSAWIEGVRRAMAADPAWELPGQPKAMPDASLAPPPVPEDGAVPQPARAARASARSRRWNRVATLPLAFVAVFGLGLVSGFLLLESPAPAGRAALVAATPSQAPAAPEPVAALPEAAPKSAEISAEVAAAVAAPATPVAQVETPKPMPEAAAPPSVAAEPAPTPALAAAPAATPAPVPRPEPAPPLAAEAPPPAPVEAPAVQLATGPASGGGSMATPPSETRIMGAPPIGEALPMAPPPAPAPPVRVSSPRPAPVIDRVCSQALFRFQQGERLTAAEQNFVRSGCSTTRR